MLKHIHPILVNYLMHILTSQSLNISLSTSALRIVLQKYKLFSVSKIELGIPHGVNERRVSQSKLHFIIKLNLHVQLQTFASIIRTVKHAQTKMCYL